MTAVDHRGDAVELNAASFVEREGGQGTSLGFEQGSFDFFLSPWCAM